MKGAKKNWLVVILWVLFNSQCCCCSGCDIKKDSVDPHTYYHGRWRLRFMKSSYPPQIEFWIRPLHEENLIGRIEIEDARIEIEVDNVFMKWAKISFKSWIIRNRTSTGHQCMSAAIVNDEHVIKQVLKCPEDLESLNYIHQKKIYINKDADFSFGCDPTEETAPMSKSKEDFSLSPTYAQMVALIVLLSITFVMNFLCVALYIYMNYRIKEKRSMLRVQLERMQMLERTATVVENNYEEIQSPEPSRTPTAQHTKDSQQSF